MRIALFALQLWLLVTAAVLIMFPQARAELPHGVLWVPLMLQFTVGTVRVWRAGYMRSTPDGIYTTLRSGGPRVTTSPLEGAAVFAGIIAALVMAWT